MQRKLMTVNRFTIDTSKSAEQINNHIMSLAADNSDLVEFAQFEQYGFAPRVGETGTVVFSPKERRSDWAARREALQAIATFCPDGHCEATFTETEPPFGYEVIKGEVRDLDFTPIYKADAEQVGKQLARLMEKSDLLTHEGNIVDVEFSFGSGEPALLRVDSRVLDKLEIIDSVVASSVSSSMSVPDLSDKIVLPANEPARNPHLVVSVAGVSIVNGEDQTAAVLLSRIKKMHAEDGVEVKEDMESPGEGRGPRR